MKRVGEKEGSSKGTGQKEVSECKDVHKEGIRRVDGQKEESRKRYRQK